MIIKSYSLKNIHNLLKKNDSLKKFRTRQTVYLPINKFLIFHWLVNPIINLVLALQLVGHALPSIKKQTSSILTIGLSTK